MVACLLHYLHHQAIVASQEASKTQPSLQLLACFRAAVGVALKSQAATSVGYQLYSFDQSNPKPTSGTTASVSVPWLKLWPEPKPKPRLGAPMGGFGSKGAS